MQGYEDELEGAHQRLEDLCDREVFDRKVFESVLGKKAFELASAYAVGHYRESAKAINRLASESDCEGLDRLYSNYLSAHKYDRRSHVKAVTNTDYSLPKSSVRDSRSQKGSAQQRVSVEDASNDDAHREPSIPTQADKLQVSANHADTTVFNKSSGSQYHTIGTGQCGDKSASEASEAGDQGQPGEPGEQDEQWERVEHDGNSENGGHRGNGGNLVTRELGPAVGAGIAAEASVAHADVTASEDGYVMV